MKSYTNHIFGFCERMRVVERLCEGRLLSTEKQCRRKSVSEKPSNASSV